MSRILPTPLVFISGYVNTENVFYCLTVIQLDLTLVNFFLSVHYNARGVPLSAFLSTMFLSLSRDNSFSARLSLCDKLSLACGVLQARIWLLVERFLRSRKVGLVVPNLVLRASPLPFSSFAPGVKMRDPGNEVGWYPVWLDMEGMRFISLPAIHVL